MEEPQFLWGIGLAMLGGMLQGAMLWPMKFMRRWEWENTWLGFSTAAYLVAPWALAFATVTHMGDVLGQVGGRTLALTSFFGLAWGLGTVMFGLGIAAVGLGLGYAVIMGLTVSVGTLVPLVALAPQELGSRRGWILIVGVAAIIVGTSLCSYAGRLREKKLGMKVPTQGATARWPYSVGILLCVGAGILIPGGNLALTFGSEITRQAQLGGASPLRAINALWAVVEVPLFVCSAAYCSWLLRRNRSWGRFSAPGTRHYWLLIVAMGTVQMSGIALYGFGAASLGLLGTSIGFSILMSSMVITANGLGVISGEWKGSGRVVGAWMAAGLTILTAAIFLIGYGNRPGG